MAGVILAEQADVIVQAIGEVRAETGILSALGQVESGVRSAFEQQESGIRSAPDRQEGGIFSASLSGEVPVAIATSESTQAQPEVENVRVCPDVNVDRPPESVREGGSTTKWSIR